MIECVNEIDNKFKGNTRVLKLEFMLALHEIEQKVLKRFTTDEQTKIESYKTMLRTKNPKPFVCILPTVLGTVLMATSTISMPFAIMLVINAVLAGMYMFTILQTRDYINLHKMIKMVESNAINKED